MVHNLTGGKKLRPDHYLDKLSAEDLQQLKFALSCSGSYAEQRLLCPKRQGGSLDGELPTERTIGEIAQAMRLTDVFRGLERQKLLETSAKERFNELGMDPKVTNAVLRIIGEEVLAQEAKQQVGQFAIQAGSILVSAEASRTKGKLEEAKLALSGKKQKVAEQTLLLAREKFEMEASAKMLDKALRAKADEINNSNLSNADKIAAMRKAAFKSVDEMEKSGKVVIPK